MLRQIWRSGNIRPYRLDEKYTHPDRRVTKLISTATTMTMPHQTSLSSGSLGKSQPVDGRHEDRNREGDHRRDVNDHAGSDETHQDDRDHAPGTKAELIDEAQVFLRCTDNADELVERKRPKNHREHRGREPCRFGEALDKDFEVHPAPRDVDQRCAFYSDPRLPGPRHLQERRWKGAVGIKFALQRQQPPPSFWRKTDPGHHQPSIGLVVIKAAAADSGHCIGACTRTVSM